MTTTKLLNNDYPSDLLKCLEHSKNSLLPKAERPTTKTQCILRAPFVTDRFNNQVRHHQLQGPSYTGVSEIKTERTSEIM